MGVFTHLRHLVRFSVDNFSKAQGNQQTNVSPKIVALRSVSSVCEWPEIENLAIEGAPVGTFR
jgi:hypothetical protein